MCYKGEFSASNESATIVFPWSSDESLVYLDSTGQLISQQFLKTNGCHPVGQILQVAGYGVWRNGASMRTWQIASK